MLTTIIDSVINNQTLLTLLFAFSSTLFAIFAFFLSYMEYKRNKPKLLFHVNIGLTGEATPRVFFVFKIENIGRRTTAIKNFYFYTKSFFPWKNISHHIFPDNPVYVKPPRDLY